MKKNYFLLLLVSPLLFFGQSTMITSTEPIDLSGYTGASNHAGQGEYQIFLGMDGVLDKPIIIMDGFDPGDTRGITDIYGFLDFNGSADAYLQDGYDIVVLNFPTYQNPNDITEDVDGGADFMERNAMVLVELIKTINTDKAGNSPEQNVIIGPSMGGIISLYALNYMQASSTLNADTRLWISLDAPHLGANVPIGLQHQLNYLANNTFNPTPEVQPVINDFLMSPAARQLLYDHFNAHLTTPGGVDFDPTLTLPIQDEFRTEFLNNLNTLLDSDPNTPDFPDNTIRKVAVVNGSGIGASYLAKDGVTPVTPGFVIAESDLQFDVPNPFGFPPTITVDVAIDISMTPASGTAELVSAFNATALGGFINISSTANSGTINYNGVDAAPGGLFSLTAVTGAVPPGTATDLFNAITIDKFSFIPTVSALALGITPETSGDDINWYHNINLTSTRATTDVTPFDNTYIPDDNEDHVEINAGNAAFIDNEIRGTTLSVPIIESTTFNLERNPVDNQIILNSDRNTMALIRITDVMGKTVLQTNKQINGRTEIPVNLSQGFYILNISDENNFRSTIKFLAK